MLYWLCHCCWLFGLPWIAHTAFAYLICQVCLHTLPQLTNWCLVEVVNPGLTCFLLPELFFCVGGNVSHDQYKLGWHKPVL